MSLQASLEQLGIRLPEMLLPKAGTDLYRWCVVACDQYSAQPDYWQQVATLVGDAPSTLQAIYPEAFLEASDRETRIQSIQATMQNWLDQHRVEVLPPGFIVLERSLPQGGTRNGLLLALDLEHYDYSADSQSLIRPTEGTIVSRLPARIRVREQAPLELPHVMVLIDDPEHTVIEPRLKTPGTALYDTPLMQHGGSVRGYAIHESAAIEAVVTALAQRHQSANLHEPARPLYAVGDGNHSLATAKAVWEHIKTHTADATTLDQHPARYALVELVNLHDPGLSFKAIHRLLYPVRPEHLLQDFTAWLSAHGSQLLRSPLTDLAAAQAVLAATPAPDSLHLVFSSALGLQLLVVQQPPLTLEIGVLQRFLDDWSAQRPAVDRVLEYIHGDQALQQLSQQPEHAGFLLPAISKFRLFDAISLNGPLPRKAFSMGEADEKRYYLESRKILP